MITCPECGDQFKWQDNYLKHQCLADPAILSAIRKVLLTHHRGRRQYASKADYDANRGTLPSGKRIDSYFHGWNAALSAILPDHENVNAAVTRTKESNRIKKDEARLFALQFKQAREALADERIGIRGLPVYAHRTEETVGMTITGESVRIVMDIYSVR